MAEANSFYSHIRNELKSIEASGLLKKERVITSAQHAQINVETPSGPQAVLNFCANNYLGLSAHPEVVKAAQDALATHGFGLSSVRFICGTQDLHKTLEARLSEFLGTEDTILYAAAFDANGGLFEPSWVNRMPLSVMSLTMHPSSTVSDSAKLSAIAIVTMIWPMPDVVVRKLDAMGLALSLYLPMESSPWMAPLLN